ncbi:MAG: hydroxyacid dehydrogenase [Lactobacillus sp.]|nr:MAG: hydroxyacid dehydrogenase [Lactobacillus sp.]
MGWNILLPQPIQKVGSDYLIEHGHNLIKGSGMETENVIHDIKGVDAMVVRLSKITREVFEAADQLKVVVRHGAGFDTVDLDAAKEFGVKVLYCPTANSMSVAETAVFYMLYLSRNFTKVQKRFVEDYYTAKLRTPKTMLEGKTVGIIGCGNVGSRVAQKCKDGFHMRVLAYDPYKPAKDFPEGVEVVRDIDRILKESDYVSLHVPKTKITEGLIDKTALAKMKPTAFLINTARGPIVNQDDLVDALNHQVIAGAGLDVMKEEPIPADNPLLQMDNVVIAPHIGAATVEAANRASYQSAQGIEEVYEGKTPSWPVKKIDWDTAQTYND